LNHRIGSAFSIQSVDKPLQISSVLQYEVDQLWMEEVHNNPYLFDGMILSALEVGVQGLVGRWVNYRYALTAYRRPDLANELGINPVAVNGYTVVGKRVLLARRACYVAQYPGAWELAPSGGIDPRVASGDEIDYRAALLHELEEETGVVRSKVLSIEPYLLLFDPLTAAWEMVLQVVLPTDFSEQLGSDEYQEFRWVEKEALKAFVESHRDKVVPLTQMILQITSTFV